MKLFVSDYGTYNEIGILGKWFDLTDYSDEIDFLEAQTEYFKELDKEYPLLNGPREEPMYQDFEGFPSSLYYESMGESGLKEIYEYINFVNDELSGDEEASEAFIEMMENIGYKDVSSAIVNWNYNFQGQYKEFSDFAYEMFESEFSYIEDRISYYFDHDKYDSDLRYSFTEY